MLALTESYNGTHFPEKEVKMHKMLENFRQEMKINPRGWMDMN